MKRGFIAGFLGAVVLIVIMYVMQIVQIGEPGFVGIGKAMLGDGLSHVILHIISAIGFAVAGGIWGLIFAAVVPNPNIIKGMLFGFAPTFFLWLVIAPLTGKPLFNGFALPGIVLPIIFNVVIWGSFTGWYLSRKN